MSASRPWSGSKWIRKERRIAIYMRDEYTCAYCARDLQNAPPQEVTLDHIIPWSLGGTNESHNLVTACKRDNSARGNAPLSPATLRRITAQARKPLNMPLARAIVSRKAPSEGQGIKITFAYAMA
jgi:5-methylcytosine-specific restriction endonuclease McrA